MGNLLAELTTAPQKKEKITVNLMVTPEEAARIRKAIKDHGWTQRAFFRAAVFDALDELENPKRKKR